MAEGDRLAVPLTPEEMEAASKAVARDETAERAVIGALLIHSVYGSGEGDNDVPYRLGPLLSASDFHFEEYAWYYEAALALAERGEEITPTTIVHELTPARVESIGGLDQVYERLVGTTAETFTAIGIEAHARVITAMAVYRRMLQAAGQLAQLATSADPASLDTTLSAAVALVQGLAEGRAALSAISIREVAVEIGSGKELDPDYRRGITAGYPALDAKVQGLVPGEIVTIGAHTTVGKTSFALGMARRQAERDIGVGYIPIEGNRKTLAHRIAASYAGVSLYYARAEGGWPEGAYDKYYNALGILAELPIHFPSRYISDVEDLVNWITVQKHQEGLSCFYVDHIDAMGSQREFRSRQAEIAHIMRTLEHTARREEVVIVVLSQVNRAVKRSKHPSMDQMREAGAKEELSQLVIMLHQDPDDGSFRVRVDKMTEGVVGPVVRSRSGDPAFELNRMSGAIDEVRSPGYTSEGVEPKPWAE